MYLIPVNTPEPTEYAPGIGWVLSAAQDCAVCGDRAEGRTVVHPHGCKAYARPGWAPLPELHPEP